MTTVKQRHLPELPDLLFKFKNDIIKSINAINIGVIESFNTVDQTASIQLSISKVVELKPDGTKVLKQRPALVQVPCIIIGGQTSNIRCPIKKGDIAIIFFNDKDIDNWFVAGDATPNTYRSHDIADGIALCGLHNLTNAISDYLNDRISINFDSSNKIEVLNSLVNIITTLCKIQANLEVTGSTILDGTLKVNGATTATSIKASGEIEGDTLKADNGASAIMISKLPVQLTVKDGIITSISY